MDKRNKSFESIFQETLGGSTTQPSPRVLRNIKRKLFVADFLSLNYRKFNIGYVSIFLVALFVSPSLINKRDNNISSVENQKMNSKFSVADKNTSTNKTHKNENSNTKDKSIEENSGSLLLTASYVSDVSSGCAPLIMHFQNKSANAKQFNWDFGNGEKSNSENPVVTFRNSGIYKVKLTASNQEGNEAHFTQTIEVFEKPEANFKIDVVKSDLNTKEIVFDNTSTSAKSYKWSFGDKSTSEEAEPEHMYSKFGTYNVSLISISNNGCSDTLTKTNSFIAQDYRLVFPRQFKPRIDQANNGDYTRPENKPFVFYPQNSGAKEYHLVVSAANGNEVFSTDNIKQGWNGYIRGRIAPAGTYIYKVYGVYPNNKEFSLSGKVNLLVANSYENYNNN